ncbi:MAG: SIR2 family protein [Sulfuricella denitrificans]|nr:SIR2 family protein [Sulfuricella denitrificans]
MSTSQQLDVIIAALAEKKAIPYLGPGMLAQVVEKTVPATAVELADQLAAKTTLPFKIRKNLTAAAQYIENFKHRKTLVTMMNEIFAHRPEPAPLHRHLAELQLPLIVDAWYDGTMAAAMAGSEGWGLLQGVSRAEHFDQWVKYYLPDGTPGDAAQAEKWRSVLYQPIGSASPASNYIVSDSDYVEVLTEIDIQSPIPALVQVLRKNRSFLFLGCRFDNQLTRSYARQIMKRSGAGPHWVVLPGELTKNEVRFMQEQNITRLDMDLNAFFDAVTEALPAAA